MAPRAKNKAKSAKSKAKAKPKQAEKPAAEQGDAPGGLQKGKKGRKKASIVPRRGIIRIQECLSMASSIIVYNNSTAACCSVGVSEIGRNSFSCTSQ